MTSRFCRNVFRSLLAALAFAGFNAHAAAPAGAWWDGNYTYRQQISVAAGASALVTAYSTSITFDHAAQVSAGRSVASGNDMRIVYWNGTTWIELDRVMDPDSAWNSATSKIWFVTQAAIASGGTDDNYYLYYGFTGSSTPSSTTPLATATNIFLFYDDFTTATVDTTKWTNGGATQTGGVLTVSGGSQIRSVNAFNTATIYETRAKLSSASAPTGSFSYFGANSSANNNFTAPYLRFLSTTIVNHTAEDSQAATTTQTFVPTAPTSFQLYAIARESTTVARFLVNGTAVASFAQTASATALRILIRDDAAAAQNEQYQWVRVRNYRNPEPVLTVGGQSTFTPVPVASYSFEEASWNGTAGEVKDSSANAINGAAKGSANTANTSPAVGNAGVGSCRYATLNGTNAYVQIPSNAKLNMTTAYGFAAWVRHHTNTYKNWETMVAKADSTYRIHLNGGCNITATLPTSTTNGITEGLNSGCTTADLNSNQIPAANTWYHVGATFRNGEMRIYINGALINSAAYSPPTIATVATDLAFGENLGNTGRLWDGDLDEVTLWDQPVSQATIQQHMAATHACGPPHFTIAHDGFGINCLPERVTVNLLDAANNPYLGYTQTVTISTGTTSGTWSLITGNGTLSATVNGNATYTWAANESTVVFGLSYQLAGPITPSVSGSGATSATAAALSFSPSGFTVTSAPLSNPPPATIPTFTSPQIAGNNVPVYLTAYGQTPTDSQCGVIEAYTGAKNLKFWSGYTNPTTGTRTVSINATAIATTEAASAAQAVTFTNGQANVTAIYRDAGIININVKDDTTGNPSLPNGIRGSTGDFVSRPSTFVVSNIRRTSDNVANPGATGAAGAVFLAAGLPFSATVTAMESGGTATPNFGKEISPESVSLTPTLVLPSPGNNPAIGGTGFGAFTGGAANATDFTWGEVGIITLTPHIKDLDYLGIGDFNGTTTGNVGRFIPYNFAVSQTNSPSIAPACTASGYDYIGQPLTYFTPPILSVTARAFGGSTTTNYQGLFYKLTNTSSTGRNYSTSAGTLDQTGLPANDPAQTSTGNGTATLTFNTAAGIFYTRSTPVAPFTPTLTLSLNVLDTDGVAYSNSTTVLSSNPFTINSPSITAPEMRYGRIAFRNAVGSELMNLPLPMHAEYFISPAVGFIQNSADSCTTGVTLAFANYGGNLNAGETCLLDTGSPGVSGLGCSTAGAVGQQFRMPPVNGDFIAILKAPGAGNGGTVTLTTTVPSWLQFDWNTSAAGLENPSGVATFGVFQGESKRIFQIEK